MSGVFLLGPVIEYLFVYTIAQFRTIPAQSPFFTAQFASQNPHNFFFRTLSEGLYYYLITITITTTIKSMSLSLLQTLSQSQPQSLPLSLQMNIWKIIHLNCRKDISSCNTGRVPTSYKANCCNIPVEGEECKLIYGRSYI